jgi:hypothetical protein
MDVFDAHAGFARRSCAVALATLVALVVLAEACEPVTADRPPLLLQGNLVDASAGDAWMPGPDAGTVSVLASGVATPSSIALDSSNVYWTDRVGAVWSVPRTGGSTTLLTTGQSSPLGIVVAGNGYWVSGNSQGGGSVVTFSFATGTASTLVSGLEGFYGVAAAPDDVFWTARSATGTAVELDHVGVDGGGPARLASVAGAVSAGGLAIDVETAYFAVSFPGGGGAVASVPLGGGPPAMVWTTVSGQPSDVALGSGGIYWLIPTATPLGAVWAMTPGGAPAPLVSGLDSPGHLGVDDVNAYWTSPGEGDIYAVPLAGGSPVVLAGNLYSPLALVVDDAIYFTTIDSVLKLTK